MQTLEQLSPTTALMIRDIETIEALPKNQKLQIMHNWRDCVVGEAHGHDAGYRDSCVMCSFFALQIADIVQLAYLRYHEYASPKSTHWREYRLAFFNKVKEESGFGYTYDNTGLNKLKADFVQHFVKEHGV